MSSTERAGSESASRSSGLLLDELARRRTARPPAGRRRVAGGADDGHHAEVLEGVRQVAGRRPATLDGLGDQVERGRRRPCRRRSRAPARPWPRPAVDTSVDAPGAGPARVRSIAATPKRSSPTRAASRRGGAAGRRARLGRSARRLGRGSAHQSLRRRSCPSAARRPRGRRGTARRPGSDAPSSSRLSPTMRPASAVASAPTSARSEVTACWRSASIWALPCSTMRVDSVWACSRISATIAAPCSRASSRMRAASCRASASCFSSSASLASASACLVSAAASPPSIAVVRSANVFSKLGTTNFLTARKSRPKTTSERMISIGCGQRAGCAPLPLPRADGRSVVHGSPSRSFVSGQVVRGRTRGRYR